MEQYNMLIAGIIGSVITLLITAIIDLIKEKLRDKRERSKMYFEHKLDASEKAVCWYQEAIDCWNMMKMAFDELEHTYNPITFAKFVKSSNQANKLYAETSSRLYPLFFYYDMTEIEKKHNADISMLYINDALCEIGKYNHQADCLLSSGTSYEDSQIFELKNKTIAIIKKISKAIDNQIDSLTEMENKLRKDNKV